MEYIRWTRSANGNTQIQAGTVELVEDEQARKVIAAGWARRSDMYGNSISCTADWERCREARNYAMPTPRCCVGHVTQIFADLDRIFTKHKVTWWLDYGSILGAVRNGGQIPHDKDGDAGILEDERPQVEKALKEMEALGYHVIRKGRREGTFGAGNSVKVCMSQINRTNVDLFWWHKEGDNWTRHNWCSVDKYKGRDIPNDKLFPIQRIAYEGMKLPAPADPEWFCAHRYGAGWKTPIQRNNDGVRR